MGYYYGFIVSMILLACIWGKFDLKYPWLTVVISLAIMIALHFYFSHIGYASGNGEVITLFSPVQIAGKSVISI